MNLNSNNFKYDIEGNTIDLITLKNANGIIVQITNYGGRIVSLFTPDNEGNFKDIVLGYNSIDDYINKPEVYFGAIIGRYGNRIADGRFAIDNTVYQLETNSENGKNHLHGGSGGFHNKVWDIAKMTRNGLTLTYHSKHMEEGFPGNLKVEVRYQLTNSNTLEIDFSATSDEKTIANLTHHSYFNLSGQPENSIENHNLKLYSNQYAPVNEFMIPKGDLSLTKDTPFDFSSLKPIGTHINADDKQIQLALGYDHNMVLKGNGLRSAAFVMEPVSKRTLEVLTTAPGFQFYTGNHLSNIEGKYDRIYGKHSGFCIEPQHFPNSPNTSSFPSTLMLPNERYKSTIIYKFGIFED